MAYRRTRRTTRRTTSRSRAPARSRRSTYRARATRMRRRSSSGSRELVIRVVQEGANPVARPELIGLQAAPAPRARRF